MIRTFRPGNDGFTLVEAAVSILIASLVLCSVLFFASTVVKSSKRTENSVNVLIQEKNAQAEKMFSLLKKK